MLKFLRRGTDTPSDGAPVLVLLHGRGSHMGDLQGLVELLPPNGVLLTPQAPHSGKPWGYGPGWAWYQYLGEDVPDAGTLAKSLTALGGFLDEIPPELGFRPGPLVLGGFSQGGTTSLAYALSNPARAAGVVNLSGFLPRPPGMALHPTSLGAMPLFWGHGTQHPAVPFELAVRGRETLMDAGADLTSGDYPMGHWVSAEELVELRAWLREKVPGWG